MSFQNPQPTPRAEGGATLSRMIRVYIDAALAPLRDRMARQEGLNRTQSVDGLETATLAVLVADATERLYQGRIMLCTDCRKSGEGGGSGTGLPVWFDSSGSTWRNFFDNAAAIS